MKFLLFISILFSFSAVKAASICEVYAENNVTVACDGKNVALNKAAEKAENPLTAELLVLLKKGYRIVSSTGGNAFSSPSSFYPSFTEVFLAK